MFVWRPSSKCLAGGYYSFGTGPFGPGVVVVWCGELGRRLAVSMSFLVCPLHPKLKLLKTVPALAFFIVATPSA